MYNFLLSGTFRDNELLLIDVVLKTLTKSAWKPFETEFEDVLSALARHTKILEAETTFAHLFRGTHNFWYS